MSKFVDSLHAHHTGAASGCAAYHWLRQRQAGAADGDRATDAHAYSYTPSITHIGGHCNANARPLANTRSHSDSYTGSLSGARAYSGAYAKAHHRPAIL